MYWLESYLKLPIFQTNEQMVLETVWAFPKYHLLQNISQFTEYVFRESLERGNAERRGQSERPGSLSCGDYLQHYCVKRLYLRRKSVYWECLMRPVRIMIVWKIWRSMAHSLMSVRAKESKRETQSPLDCLLSLMVTQSSSSVYLFCNQYKYTPETRDRMVK